MTVRAPPTLRRPRTTVSVAVACAGLALALLISCTVGSMFASPAQVLRGMGALVSGDVNTLEERLLVHVRFPRAALGLCVGATLGLSGAAMQVAFRNPLVDPGLLGVSSGAAFGAVLCIVLGARIFGGLPPGLAPWLLPATAFAFAFVAMNLVRRLAQTHGRTSPSTLLLAGIGVNAAAGAGAGLLTFIASDAQLRSITFWSLGSLGDARWSTVLAVGTSMLLAAVLLLSRVHALDAMLLGDAEAYHLGVDVDRTRRIILVAAALAVGAQVAITGVIAFVGLCVPHLVRLAVGPKHTLLLPLSAAAGAALLLVADAFARSVVTPAEVPVGVVTAGLGAPFFLFLLVREKERAS